MAGGRLSNTPHPTPPRTEEDRLDWLRLIRSHRVGATTFHRLLTQHGSAAAALRALPEVARDAGVGDYHPCSIERARTEFARARDAGLTPVFHGAPDYPRPLLDLADAPPILWVRGRISLFSHPMIAIVGARNASSLGTRMARQLAHALGEAGFVIVSGLARGIDSAAHDAAVESGTVAVLAGGTDVIYPESNARLAEQIAHGGALLSEQPVGTRPQARHFPMRNRIISGLARATLVIEAAARSGSLITAHTALDQGREVLAVPGHPFDARAAGCNMLIRDGAILVRDAADVIEAIGQPMNSGLSLPFDDTPAANAGAMPPPPRHERRERSGRQDEAREKAEPENGDLRAAILDHLGPSPLAEDQLIRDLALSAARVAPELLMLELEGRIRRQPGGLLSLA